MIHYDSSVGVNAPLYVKYRCTDLITYRRCLIDAGSLSDQRPIRATRFDVIVQGSSSFGFLN